MTAYTRQQVKRYKVDTTWIALSRVTFTGLRIYVRTVVGFPMFSSTLDVVGHWKPR